MEAIASQNPKELTRYFEQMSGSLELKDEYDKLKEIQDKATEQSTFNFTKKRGLNSNLCLCIFYITILGLNSKICVINFNF